MFLERPCELLSYLLWYDTRDDQHLRATVESVVRNEEGNQVIVWRVETSKDLSSRRSSGLLVQH